MSAKFKAFKSSRAAYKAAAGKPMIRIGNITLVMVEGDMSDFQFAEISIAARTGDTTSYQIVGEVICGHLNRLGNANHATAHPAWARPDIFARENVLPLKNPASVD
jgi:hypothetical protein